MLAVGFEVLYHPSFVEEMKRQRVIIEHCIHACSVVALDHPFSLLGLIAM